MRRVVAVVLCWVLLLSSLPMVGAAASYPDLGYGDINDDVEILQQRLRRLGYLKDTVDGEYGACTMRAVEYFQYMHGYKMTGYADSAMQEHLFSSEADYFDEEYYDLLALPAACVGWQTQWKGRSKKKDTVQFRVRVANTRDDVTVQAFTVYAYFTDVYGERVHDGYYTWTTKEKIKPLGVKWSDYATIPDASEIYYCYFAVGKERLKDGTVNELNEEDMNFLKCVYDE